MFPFFGGSVLFFSGFGRIFLWLYYDFSMVFEFLVVIP